MYSHVAVPYWWPQSLTGSFSASYKRPLAIRQHTTGWATSRRQGSRPLGRWFPRQPSRAARLWPLLDAATVIALNYTASYRYVPPRGTSALVNRRSWIQPGGGEEGGAWSSDKDVDSHFYLAALTAWLSESESFIKYQENLLVALY